MQLTSTKLKEPYKAIAQLDASELIRIIDNLNTKVTAHNILVNQLNSNIESFKQSLDTEKLEKEISKTREAYKNIKLQLERLNKNDACNGYKNLQTEEQETALKYKNAQQNLETQQSNYLDIYFAAINKYFKSFGSRDFTLEKKFSSGGNAPVYFLGVRYKGSAIDEKKLGSVFSESDRRALALAVFWAKLDNFSKEEKCNLIMVLDDPVTSFDDHRISNTLMEISKVSTDVGQLILLSHYKQCLTAYFNTYSKAKPEPKLLKLTKKNNTSVIEVGDIESFLFTEHQKKFRKIQRFINREINEDIGKDLRIFLEEELANRFRKQISDSQINLGLKFSSRIDECKNKGVISEAIAKELHEWREILNVDHHSWTERDEEDRRNLTIQLMNFIYHELLPS
jgi:wobble nucleotide-excising tRNase